MNTIAGVGLPFGEEWKPDDKIAPRADHGVYVNCPGVRFFFQKGLIGNHTHLRDENGVWFEVMFHHRHADGVIEDNNPYSPSRVTIDPFELFGCREVAVLHEWLGPLGEHSEYGTQVINGILVGIDREEEDGVYCHEILHCSTVVYGGQTYEERNKDFNEALPFHMGYGAGLVIDEENWKVYLAGGKSIPATQRWCVG
ncbi:hypothetical protein BJX66DRAFT_161705 [Aspergillus keveii]|uniref:Uncharacterized protein n=1 Tax=Aspergillus keveii TaxID=714993 RepID=A0ABR4FHT1_9EURO